MPFLRTEKNRGKKKAAQGLLTKRIRNWRRKELSLARTSSRTKMVGLAYYSTHIPSFVQFKNLSFSASISETEPVWTTLHFGSSTAQKSAGAFASPRVASFTQYKKFSSETGSNNWAVEAFGHTLDGPSIRTKRQGRQTPSAPLSTNKNDLSSKLIFFHSISNGLDVFLYIVLFLSRRNLEKSDISNNWYAIDWKNTAIISPVSIRFWLSNHLALIRIGLQTIKVL